MKKRKHHYVWRYYLNSWAKNNLIWCYRDGKIFNPNLMGVAQSRDFYKLNEMKYEDMKIIYDSYIKPLNPNLEKINKGWINLFNVVFLIRKFYEENNINTLESTALVNEYIHNLEEELHAKIEKNATKYIKLILKEDVEFYRTNEGCAIFSHYICIQYFRTQKMKSNFMRNSEKFDIDIETTWNVLSHIFATNISYGLYINKETYRMVLLKNNTGIEFITSDHPVINTCAIGLSETTAPEELELYYPLSPELAILITNNIKIRNSNIIVPDKYQVENYNKIIVQESDSQIFASSKEALLPYL